MTQPVPIAEIKCENCNHLNGWPAPDLPDDIRSLGHVFDCENCGAQVRLAFKITNAALFGQLVQTPERSQRRPEPQRGPPPGPRLRVGGEGEDRRRDAERERRTRGEEQVAEEGTEGTEGQRPASMFKLTRPAVHRQGPTLGF